jgi:UDP-N-acetylglucosamine 3-dehydrogenase
MSELLSMGVVGVGRMGTNHVRVLADLEGVRLAAVCDTDRQIAERAARRYLVPSFYGSLEELLSGERLDGVVIATPTSGHRQALELCARRGVHVLLEKPMASTPEECEEILGIAREWGVHVFTGHIERYNPVIVQLKQFLDESYLGDLYYVETVRSGPFPKRLYGSKDGVVIDLAVHDLDLVHYLFGRLAHLFAQHIQTDTHKQDIYARIMFKTEGGILGSSEFSWISPRKERSLSIYGDKGMLLGNLVDQEVWFYENGDVGIDYSDNYYQNVIWGRVSEGKVIKFPIRKEEPLRRELESFCGLIRGEIAGFEPSYGKLAVEYSVAVLSSARCNDVVRLSRAGGAT